MQPRMTKQEVSHVAEALCEWFISQDISVPNSAIVMIHLLGVMMGDHASDVSDLKTGAGMVTEAIAGIAAHAFCTKHGINPDTL